MSEKLTTISGVLEAWENEIASGSSDIGSIFRAAGTRAAGPLLFLPALVLVTPLGALPGVPFIVAAIVILIAGQLALGFDTMWFPKTLKQRKIPQDKAMRVIEKLDPYAAKLDQYVGRRLPVFTQGVMLRVVAVVCIIMALLTYPAAFIPFGAALPGVAIIFISLGVLTRDGLVTLAGLITSGLATYVLISFLL